MLSATSIADIAWIVLRPPKITFRICGLVFGCLQNFVHSLLEFAVTDPLKGESPFVRSVMFCFSEVCYVPVALKVFEVCPDLFQIKSGCLLALVRNMAFSYVFSCGSFVTNADKFHEFPVF